MNSNPMVEREFRADSILDKRYDVLFRAHIDLNEQIPIKGIPFSFDHIESPDELAHYRAVAHSSSRASVMSLPALPGDTQ